MMRRSLSLSNAIGPLRASRQARPSPVLRRVRSPLGSAALLACWSVQQFSELISVWQAWLLLIVGSGGLAWSVLASSGSTRAANVPAAVRPGVARPATGAWLIALLGFAAFFGWASLRAHWALENRIGAGGEGQDVTVIGVVAEMPQPFDRGLRFGFRVEQCADDNADACRAGALYRLNWYSGSRRQPDASIPAIVPGQRWRLTVRLKRPQAPLNPGLFDSELRSLEEGVSAVGYVRTAADPEDGNQLLAERVWGVVTTIERLRTRIRQAIFAATPSWPREVTGVLAALVIGDQGAVPPRWWERFNRTGVGHLMSISGLHITMLAGMAGWLTSRFWSSRFAVLRNGRPLAAIIPKAHARWTVGVLTGFAYSALAGWGIPAQRTCWMLAFAGLAMLSGRSRSSVSILSATALAVVAIDPWSPIAAGFWLSFAAVGAIIWYGSQRHAPHSLHSSHASHSRGSTVPASRDRWAWLREALRTQWAATLSLLPLGALFFSSFSIVGPLANAIAIPLVSGLITPLALLGGSLEALIAGAGWLPLWLAAFSTDWLLKILAWLDSGRAAALVIAQPGMLALALSIAGCALLLAPLHLPGRWLACFALGPLLSTPVQRPPAGELWLTALDVGQGMAVLVETTDHRILYDTGPQYSLDSEAGSRIIVPYLRSRGITQLDLMVVSHQDNDHSGGALAVLRSITVDRVATSLSSDHPIVAASPRHEACRRFEGWAWAPFEFEWLHPGDDQLASGRSTTNARSCVLRIKGPAGVVLLAGDIEAPQEKRLLELFDADRLHADVLLVPHHGSATSSIPAFIAAVDPSLAIFQVGYRNRFRHPNVKVLQRYESSGIQTLRSDYHAAIQVRMKPGSEPQIGRYRLDQPRYWRIQVDPQHAVDPPR